MKLGDSKAIKTAQWFPNELLRDTDINFISYASYHTATEILASLAERGVATGSTPDTVLTGLHLIWSSLLSCQLKAGAAVSFSGSYLANDVWGFVAESGRIFSVVVPEDTAVAFDTGGSNNRIDIVEVRPVIKPYGGTSRNFKDPITGLVTTTLVNTRREYGFEFHILKGTEATNPVAPARTAGWVKIAEVYIAASATSIIQSKIKDFRDSNAWTTDPDDTKPAPDDAGVALNALATATAGHNNSLLFGGIVTKGTGDTLDITGMRFVLGEQYRVVASKNDMALPDAVLDGVATNYVKLTWTGDVVVDTNPATNGIILAILVGTAGGAFTIEQTHYPQGSTVAVSSADISVPAGAAAIEMSTGASDRTVYLPDISINRGRRIIIRKTDSGVGKVLVVRASSNTINGTTLWEITEQYGYVVLRENGTEWEVESQDGSVFKNVITTDQSQESPTTSVWYNLGGSLTLNPGMYKLLYECHALYAPANASTTVEIYTTLSKANNTEDDKELTTKSAFSDSTSNIKLICVTLGRSKLVLVASPTTFYLNVLVPTGYLGTLQVAGSQVHTIIRAERVR